MRVCVVCACACVCVYVCIQYMCVYVCAPLNYIHFRCHIVSVTMPHRKWRSDKWQRPSEFLLGTTIQWKGELCSFMYSLIHWWRRLHGHRSIWATVEVTQNVHVWPPFHSFLPFIFTYWRHLWCQYEVCHWLEVIIPHSTSYQVYCSMSVLIYVFVYPAPKCMYILCNFCTLSSWQCNCALGVSEEFALHASTYLCHFWDNCQFYIEKWLHSLIATAMGI